jgi:uncharacterized protein (DUF58 family)
MPGWGVLGAALIVVGALAGVPGLVFVGLLVLATTWLRTLWSRRGLQEVSYERHLATDRAVWGDEIGLDVTVWNRKLLPLAWLRTDDFVSEEAELRERPLAHSERPGQRVLANTWTLAWFERVTRHFHLRATRRGVYRFNAVRLQVADIFARDAASVERPYPATFVVRPRSVPVRRTAADRAPLGSRKARHSLFHDPALFAGVRPYEPGDPPRRLHWKATARLGRPVSKRFDPSREREIILALDVQTVPGPNYWLMVYDDKLLESLCVAAASLARSILGDGAACGLAAAAYAGTVQRMVYVPPGGGAGQLALIADHLGRLSRFASAPYESLLTSLAHRVAPGSTILTLSARDPAPYLPAMRRLARSGYPVRHVALGPEALGFARRVRAAGIPAEIAELNPDWKTANALVIAG